MQNRRIVGLRAENVMRLKAVEIKPGNTSVVVVGGNNAQGKTSLLESIAMALGGAKAVSEQPVRREAQTAIIIADLGDIVVTRNFKAGGVMELEVKGKDGQRYSSPQKMLDAMVGKIAFDPIQFMTMSEDKRLSTLKEIVKLDFSEMDAQRGLAYDQRKDVNRDIESLKAQMDALPIMACDEEKEEVDVTELSRRIAEADVIGETLNDLECSGRSSAEAEKRLQEQIDALKQDLVKQKENTAALRKRWEEKDKLSKTLDVSALLKELEGANQTNATIRKHKERKRISDLLDAKQGERSKLEKEMGDIDIAKEKAMTAAKFPVKGLSFNDKGVLFNGVPFSQASGAEKLRTSLAIGIALNPEVRVMIIRDGSLLDEVNMQVVKEMAETNDMQVWLERVGNGEECSIVIEDGMVKESRLESPTVKAEKPKTQGTRKPSSGPRAKA